MGDLSLPTILELLRTLDEWKSYPDGFIDAVHGKQPMESTSEKYYWGHSDGQIFAVGKELTSAVVAKQVSMKPTTLRTLLARNPHLGHKFGQLWMIAPTAIPEIRYRKDRRGFSQIRRKS